MWSSWGESAKASMSQALEKTGDVLSKAATAARHAHPQSDEAAAASATSAAGDATEEPQPAVAGRYADAGGDAAAKDEDGHPHHKSPEPWKNLQAGWSSVVETTMASIKTAQETTKASIKTAQEVVEEQQFRINERLHQARTAYYKRDPKLPLDVAALQDAQVVYVTDRLITMSHPAMASTVDGDITAERKLAAVGHLLQCRHDGRFMVWNLSEVDYDVSILDEQVLTFSFPGSPSPPLGLLLKILVSMEAWLKADDRNVAVVHCLTGKGRTSTVLAAFLCWMGQAGFADVYHALEYIASCKQMTTDELTIPSQRRYTSYFKNMLDGVRPSQPPLMLKRIIMSQAPRYAKGPLRDKDKDNTNNDTKKGKTADDEDMQRMGCAPYLQLFKAGNLLHTAPASLHFQQSSDELPFCQVADGSISFHVNQVVQGDILVRCRHLTAKKQRLSMFRAAFHTGYVPPNVMRLTKSQLDGACDDDRFNDDFFLDLIFEPVGVEAASKLLKDDEALASGSPAAVEGSHASEAAQTLAGGATTVTASAYDSMLHRDSRFWDVISARRQEQAKAVPAEKDTMWGPTVGRRREFGAKEEADTDTTTQGKQIAESGKTEQAAKQNELETFSIGGEFDFLPAANEAETTPVAPVAPTTNRAPAKKDSLMEALMGALDDEDEVGNAEDEEEIVFDNTDVQTKPAVAAPTIVAIPDAGSEQDDGTQSSSENALSSAAEGSTGASTPVRQDSSAGESSQAADDVAALLEDADLDLDVDMDGMLDDDDVDDDLLDLDDDDLEDLEKFLSPGK
jgi:tensin